MRTYIHIQVPVDCRDEFDNTPLIISAQAYILKSQLATKSPTNTL